MPSHKMPYYSEQNIEALNNAHKNIETTFTILATHFDSIKFHGISDEYMTNGVFRRINTLKKCIDRIFEILPPSHSEIPSHDTAVEASIFLQCFLINTYGLIENFARIYAETNGPLLSEKSKRNASFLSMRGNPDFKKITSKAIRDFFAGAKIVKWKNYLCDFRHALAHRIPLYIPTQHIPIHNETKYKSLEAQKSIHNFREIEAKQIKLAEFVPMATHSFSEMAPGLIFHAQVIADWNTVIAFLCVFLKEMQCPAGANIADELSVAAPEWNDWAKGFEYQWLKPE